MVTDADTLSISSEEELVLQSGRHDRPPGRESLRPASNDKPVCILRASAPRHSRKRRARLCAGVGAAITGVCKCRRALIVRRRAEALEIWKGVTVNYESTESPSIRSNNQHRDMKGVLQAYYTGLPLSFRSDDEQINDRVNIARKGSP